ncbi:hypothetical protein [Elongatibacter sediminis]|uniref:Uncharacterized protein n=1 Tax=Elongatibacter sediminis TaxID=3119006 RepID=A0AAW9RC08_9GAMM
MRNLKGVLLFVFMVSGSGSALADDQIGGDDWKLDRLSYYIGNFSTFAEIVDIGLKKMALSSALPPEDMDQLEREVRQIGSDWSVEIYREPEFLVSDLFPESATADKDVLIIYRGDTLEDYFALKARKAELVEAGEYEGEARREIAWGVGKLLSYPDEKINQLLAGQDRPH